ncbi:hypothetical protein BGZ76_000354 [Entomortierella beljakovae]|nr:hypothetical protein BGZ76_000354 [Entomortierella beljakovae]
MSFRFKPPDSPTKKDELDDPFDDGGQEDQEDQGPSTPQVIQTDVNQHLVIRQRVLGDGPTLDNFTAYIYDCERNTLPGISHEVLRVPEEYWDRKRISTNLRSNLTNPEIDAPGLIKFDQVAAELIWVNEITPQENDPTLAQSMDGYISELFSRRLRRPQGCFFQNFSMYSMLGKFEQADVWFCDVIAWTKVVDSGGDTRHAAHIIIMNIAGTQSYSDIVQGNFKPLPVN